MDDEMGRDMAGLLPGGVQAQPKQVACGDRPEQRHAANGRARHRAPRLVPEWHGAAVQSAERQWTRWTVRTFTPQRVTMTSPSASAGCNMAAQMDRSSGEYRVSLRCTNRTAADYQDTCAQAEAAPAPVQRF
ncbi:MAG TPA: hypothetical protein VGN83_27225 [Falsiroseomonas sp.]|nr:hypothetical protein [Falsiroseomonas sp.]